jgi:hypothetical protein
VNRTLFAIHRDGELLTQKGRIIVGSYEDMNHVYGLMGDLVGVPESISPAVAVRTTMAFTAA